MSAFERFWVSAIGLCTNHGQLEETVNGAIRARAYGEQARWAYVQRLNQLHTEEVIRLDERIKVLREVRNTVAKAADTADPYGEGFGLWSAQKYLTWKLAEARRAAGVEPPRG